MLEGGAIAGIVIGAVIIVLILIKVFLINGRSCSIVKDLTGQVVFITGGNAGIGQATCELLSAMNPIMVIACRDVRKTEALAETLRMKCSDVHVLKLDLSDLDSVKSCVQEFKKLNLKVDILINNAGVTAQPNYVVSKQGYEMQFALNYLGHYYLTDLLKPHFNPETRVVNLSSKLHEMAKFNLLDVNCNSMKNDWNFQNGTIAYGNSKLCNILHCIMLKNHGIKAVSVHPGVVQTDIFQPMINTFFKKVLYYMCMPCIWYSLITPQQGAQCSLYCALENYEQLVSGGYYNDCRLQQPQHTSEELAVQLEKLTQTMLP